MGGEDEDSQSRVMSVATTLETPCQAALITAYVHHKELALTANARAMLIRLRTQLRVLLQAEKDRIGMTMAGFGHMQRVLKRNSAMPISSVASTEKSAATDVKGKG